MKKELAQNQLDLRLREPALPVVDHDCLEAAWRRMAIIVRDSNDAITVQDFDGNIRAWNRGAEKMYGYSEEEALQMNIVDIVPQDKKQEAMAYIQMIREGRQVESFETQRWTRDDRLLDVWLTVTALPDETGRPFLIATTERDITERNRHLKSLQRHSERVKLFAYSVMHDLKSPSIGIYGLARRLEREYGHVLDEKGKHYCEQILKGAEQIASLAENVNTYISSREMPLQIEDIKLKDLLDILEDEFSIPFRIRQIAWICPHSLPKIRADRLSILRALRNLIDNALKYSGDDLSEIRINYSASAEFHYLSVAHNGAGINSDEYESLFQPFNRKLSNNNNITGAGLGLTIVKEIAERHGGQVWAVPNPKKGVAFYLSFYRWIK